MASRGFHGRAGFNYSSYQGPYPQYEIQRARNYFSEQFSRSNSKAIRSLRRKTNNGTDFFHKEQIQSVVSESFGAIQVHSNEESTASLVHSNEESTVSQVHSNEESTESQVHSDEGSTTVHVPSNEESEAIQVHSDEEPSIVPSNEESEAIQVHSDEESTAVSGHSQIDIHTVDQDDENANNVIETVRNTATQISDEPSKKRQKLSNETLTSSVYVKTDSPESTAVERVNVDPNGNITDTPTAAGLDTLEGGSSNCNTNINEIIISDDEEEVTANDVVRELCLMCDLCSHIVRGNNSRSESKMRSHFQNARHNAASLVEAEVDGDQVIPKYAGEKMIFSNPNIQPNVYPVCPACHMVHASIWNCAIHYQKQHNPDLWDVYGLGNVVKESFDTVDLNHTCKNCHQKFPSASKLHKHWKSFRHFPFTDPTFNQIMYFSCMACGYETQSFMLIRSHALSSHHIDLKIKGETIDIRILHIQKPLRKNLLPQRPRSAETQIRSNKLTFKRSMKNMNVSKSFKKRMRNQMVEHVSRKDRESYESFLMGLNYNNYF